MKNFLLLEIAVLFSEGIEKPICVVEAESIEEIAITLGGYNIEDGSIYFPDRKFFTLKQDESFDGGQCLELHKGPIHWKCYPGAACAPYFLRVVEIGSVLKVSDLK